MGYPTYAFLLGLKSTKMPKRVAHNFCGTHCTLFVTRLVKFAKFREKHTQSQFDTSYYLFLEEVCCIWIIQSHYIKVVQGCVSRRARHNWLLILSLYLKKFSLKKIWFPQLNFAHLFRRHTVILPDWTFKKWGLSNFAFHHY